MLYIHPSFHPMVIYTAYPMWVMGELEPIQADSGQEGPGQAINLLDGLHKDKQLFKLLFTHMGTLVAS